MCHMHCHTKLYITVQEFKEIWETNGSMADWLDTYTQNFKVFAIEELSDLKNINSFYPTSL